MKKVIELRNVSKQFDGETVLDSINLDIYDNEFDFFEKSGRNFKAG